MLATAVCVTAACGVAVRTGELPNLNSPGCVEIVGNSAHEIIQGYGFFGGRTISTEGAVFTRNERACVTTITFVLGRLPFLHNRPGYQIEYRSCSKLDPMASSVASEIEEAVLQAHAGCFKMIE